MRKPNPIQHQANQTTTLKILKLVGSQVLDCLLCIGVCFGVFHSCYFGGPQLPKNFPRKSAQAAKRAAKTAAFHPSSPKKKVRLCGQKRPNCTLKRLPEKKRRGNQNERETTPLKRKIKGNLHKIRQKKANSNNEREKRRTCLNKVLPYTSNFSSHLCRCVFLASEP